ncbi:MAG TPA: UDP-glucose/GDP-mannose dehydrogenase family protein [Planctomycetota bacterium]|nr:UDP-glucose/GDP-mannose dehydrogenase family protein [Planctomycetota bacterium]
MKIAIIGSGHVGLTTGICFAEKGHEVICVDHDTDKLARLRNGEVWFFEPKLPDLLKKHHSSRRLRFTDSTAEAVKFASVIFICVGTPTGESGKADMRYVEKVARDIAETMTDYRLIVEKSTVPIMTGERVKSTILRYVRGDAHFDVASNPEFLREGSAIDDTLKPDRIVIGVDSAKAETLLREIYAPFEAPMVVTSIGSAELIKHASNSFLALKISFINWIARVCEQSGADVHEVARGMGLDARIGAAFLNAGIGYGGSCFPKDVEALAAISEELGVEAPLIRLISQINREQRERFFEAIQHELWVLQDKTIALWGLSFKPNTDDLREAPSLWLAQRLLKAGARLRVHDPVAMPAFKRAISDVYFAKDPLDATSGADALVLCTEWPQYREVDLAKVKATLRVPLIFDGRNCLDRKQAEELGMTLIGIGKQRIGPRGKH